MLKSKISSTRSFKCYLLVDLQTNSMGDTFVGKVVLAVHGHPQILIRDDHVVVLDHNIVGELVTTLERRGIKRPPFSQDIIFTTACPSNVCSIKDGTAFRDMQLFNTLNHFLCLNKGKTIKSWKVLMKGVSWKGWFSVNGNWNSIVKGMFFMMSGIARVWHAEECFCHDITITDQCPPVWRLESGVYFL